MAMGMGGDGLEPHDRILHPVLALRGLRVGHQYRMAGDALHYGERGIPAPRGDELPCRSATVGVAQFQADAGMHVSVGNEILIPHKDDTAIVQAADLAMLRGVPAYTVPC